jgi:hypothetical protein
MTNTQNEDLEKLIEQRKQEAKDKQIGLKLRTIVDMLGHTYTHGSTQTIGSTGIYTKNTTGKYEDKKFSINYESETGECSDGGGGGYYKEDIQYNKLQIYSEINCEIQIYIPGLWEEEYNKLYDEAITKKENNTREKLLRQQNIKQKEEDEKYNQLKKNFGL